MQLAVGDFVSATNTISEEQVNEVIFDYNFRTSSVQTW